MNKPEDAPESCPGTGSKEAGKADACAGCPNQSICASGPVGPDPDIPFIAQNLANIKHCILVLSGKGGVGKSTVVTNLARMLALDEEKQVGVLDVDVCGPSQPQMLGVKEESLHVGQLGISPVLCGPNDNILMISTGFLLAQETDAVIWRGSKKNSLIKQFLRDGQWGALDYLIIDTPPGTSDEHLALAQLLMSSTSSTCHTGAILVSTPQEVAWQDVRKEINFCRKTNIPILGVVENMASFVCGSCGKSSQLFDTNSSVRKWCEAEGVPLLASIPVEQSVGMATDQGLPLPPSSLSFQIYADLIHKLNNILQTHS